MSAPDNVAHAHPGAVTSPMVGTAYLKPSPDAATFVQKGDTSKPVTRS
jgi:acetyl-CoA carboxylase biotin carboxyl carrier protein